MIRLYNIYFGDRRLKYKVFQRPSHVLAGAPQLFFFYSPAVSEQHRGEALLFSRLLFTELRLCLASTKLVWTHLAYIGYLCCFSPHCNKPKCYAVHLPNRLRNGRYHSRIQSPPHLPPLPWQPPWFLFSSYSFPPISKQALYSCLICSDGEESKKKKEVKIIRTSMTFRWILGGIDEKFLLFLFTKPIVSLLLLFPPPRWFLSFGRNIHSASSLSLLLTRLFPLAY